MKDKKSFYKRKLMAMNRRSSEPGALALPYAKRIEEPLNIDSDQRGHEAPGDSLDGGDTGTANEFYEYHDSLHT